VGRRRTTVTGTLPVALATRAWKRARHTLHSGGILNAQLGFLQSTPSKGPGRPSDVHGPSDQPTRTRASVPATNPAASA
jgi:hypothetical protein